MGIPSYFSYILKNHPRIISALTIKVNNLYLDSNSIIYDSLRSLEGNHKFEERLMKAVCKKIDEYIHTTKPDNTVFIAFDGVAPVAKLAQQRNRRYLSTLEKKITKQLGGSILDWNTTAITPGTVFMDNLGSYIQNYYHDKRASLGLKNIIISTSHEVGEGEHKIFAYIRENAAFHRATTTLIYGLDADLIMLCLNHLPVSRKIYLFRETPEFVKSINADLKPNETYFLNIPLLANAITLTMNNYRAPNTVQEKNRLYDYIFLSFFLGNDFLPHFPAMNIRTHGIEILLDAYRETIGKTNNNLTNGKEIFWKHVRRFVTYLAEKEEQNLLREYRIRAKWEKRRFGYKSLQDKMHRYLHIPIKNRETEKLINPFEVGWKRRYYDLLFYEDVDRQEICQNFLEGLEWTMHYYTTGCRDWRWCYKYHYPPLLSDLLSYIPHFPLNMIVKNTNKPVQDMVQLGYVLPQESLHLIPDGLGEYLKDKNSQWYDNDCEIHWSFCKYFWESHVEVPYINISELENLVRIYEGNNRK